MTHQIDVNQLKNRIDARDLAAELFGTPGKRAGRARLYSIDGQRTGSCAVYPDGYHDFSTGEHGDTAAMLVRLGAAGDRAEAVRKLLDRFGGTGGTLTARHAVAVENPTDPPPTAWQRTMSAALDTFHTYLKGTAPDARRARAYLHQRGITDELIARYRLGYNPNWKRTDYADADRQRVSIPPGITIGWFADGALWSVHVRCREAKFAAALGVRADRDSSGDETAKYKYVTGSHIRGALFNGDELRDGLPTLFVEGEFDAMIAAAALDGVNVVTLGGASTHLAGRWRRRITGPVFVCLDNDQAGRDGAAALLKCLPPTAQRVELPAEKDMTDYVLSGGDLPAWWTAATADPTRRSAAGQADRAGQPVTSDQPPPESQPTNRLPGARYTLPFTWRRGCTIIDDTGRLGLIVECVILLGIKKKLLNPSGFTKADILDAANQLNVGISKSLIENAIIDLEKVFISRSDIEIVDESMSRCGINSKSGRPARRWKLNAYQIAQAALAHEIAKKVYEQHFVGVIAPVEALKAALTDADLPHDEAAISELQTLVVQTGALEETAARKLVADAMAAKIADTLGDHRGDPIPDDYPTRNGREYMAACAAIWAKARAQGDVYLSQQQIANELGLPSRKVAARVIKRAGIVCKGNSVEQVTLTPTRRIYEQVESVRSRVKGKALSLTAVTPDGRTTRAPYSLATAQSFMKSGATVTVSIRTSNLYTVTPDVRPLEISPAPRNAKPAQQQQTPRQHQQQSRSVGFTLGDEQARVGYSRTWLRDQLVLILERLDRVRDGKFINLETGEVVPMSAPVGVLFSLLIGREVEAVDSSNDELFAFALREWGDSVRGVKLG